jgi:hypothetical protein
LYKRFALSVIAAKTIIGLDGIAFMPKTHR